MSLKPLAQLVNQLDSASKPRLEQIVQPVSHHQNPVGKEFNRNQNVTPGSSNNLTNIHSNEQVPTRRSGSKRDHDTATASDPQQTPAQPAEQPARKKQKVTYTLPHQNMEEGHFYVVLGEDIDVSTQRFKILSLLGEGTFGKVVEAWDRKRKEYCAVKIVRNIPKYVRDAKIEIRFMETVRSSDAEDRFPIMKIQRYFLNDQNHMCIVMPKYGPCLLDWIMKYGPFSHRQLAQIVFQTAVALDFFHSELHLMHTDLKPENILMESSEAVLDPNTHRHVPPDPFNVRICDLGGCCDERHSRLAIVSTRHYRSPEVILGMGWMYSTDMWSMGCILYELYTGKLLYDTHDNLEHLHLMEKTLGRLPPEWQSRCGTDEARGMFASTGQLKPCTDPKHLARIARARPIREVLRDDLLLDLVAGLLHYDRTKRYNARQMAEHQYVLHHYPEARLHPNFPALQERPPATRDILNEAEERKKVRVTKTLEAAAASAQRNATEEAAQRAKMYEDEEGSRNGRRRNQIHNYGERGAGEGRNSWIPAGTFQGDGQAMGSQRSGSLSESLSSSLSHLQVELAKQLCESESNGGSCALTKEAFFFSISNDPAFAYSYFFADFGPLDLGCVVRFSRRLSRLLHYTNRWEWAESMYQKFNENHFQWDSITVEEIRSVVTRSQYSAPHLEPSRANKRGYLFEKVEVEDGKTKTAFPVTSSSGVVSESDEEGTTSPYSSHTLPIVFCCGLDGKERTNAICLLGCFCVAALGWTPGEFQQLFSMTQPPPRFYTPILSFRDASAGAASYPLHLSDVLSAVEKAVALRWLNVIYFDLPGYQLGKTRLDYSWIVPYKILAFSSPDDSHPSRSGSVYADTLHHFGITMVVRLNESLYSVTPFLRKGMQMKVLEFPDGTAPLDSVVQDFLKTVEFEFGELSSQTTVSSSGSKGKATTGGSTVGLNASPLGHEDQRMLVGGAYKGLPPALTREPSRRLQLVAPKDTSASASKKRKAVKNCGAVAIHCRAGLGRTGTLIGVYVMRHYFLTAREVIAWLRLCRPGSVSGVQQQYLEVMERRLAVPSSVLERHEGLHPRSTASGEFSAAVPTINNDAMDGQKHATEECPLSLSAVPFDGVAPQHSRFHIGGATPRARAAPDPHSTLAYQPHGEVPLDAARATKSLMHLVESTLGPDQRRRASQDPISAENSGSPNLSPKNKGRKNMNQNDSPSNGKTTTARLKAKKPRLGTENSLSSASSSSSQLILPCSSSAHHHQQQNTNNNHKRGGTTPSLRGSPSMELMAASAGSVPPGNDRNSPPLFSDSHTGVNGQNDSMNGISVKPFSASREGSARLSEFRRDMAETEVRVFDGTSHFIPPKDLLEGLKYPSSYLLALEVSRPYHKAKTLSKQFNTRLAAPGPQTAHDVERCLGNQNKPPQGSPNTNGGTFSGGSIVQTDSVGSTDSQVKPKVYSREPTPTLQSSSSVGVATKTTNGNGRLNNATPNRTNSGGGTRPPLSSSPTTYVRVNSGERLGPNTTHPSCPSHSSGGFPPAGNNAGTPAPIIGSRNAKPPITVSAEAAANAIAAAGIHVPHRHTSNAALTRKRAVASRYQRLKEEDIHLRAADATLDRMEATNSINISGPPQGPLSRDSERGSKPGTAGGMRSTSSSGRGISPTHHTGGVNNIISLPSPLGDRLVPLNEYAVQLHQRQSIRPPFQPFQQHGSFRANTAPTPRGLSGPAHAIGRLGAPPSHPSTSHGRTPRKMGHHGGGPPSPSVDSTPLPPRAGMDTASHSAAGTSLTESVTSIKDRDQSVTATWMSTTPSTGEVGGVPPRGISPPKKLTTPSPQSVFIQRGKETAPVAQNTAPSSNGPRLSPITEAGPTFFLSGTEPDRAVAKRQSFTVTMVSPRQSQYGAELATGGGNAGFAEDLEYEQAPSGVYQNEAIVAMRQQLLNAAQEEWRSSPGWVTPIMKLGRV